MLHLLGFDFQWNIVLAVSQTLPLENHQTIIYFVMSYHQQQLEHFKPSSRLGVWSTLTWAFGQYLPTCACLLHE